MRKLILLLAMAAACGAQAQQMDSYRYWFDDDIANAVTTAAAPAPVLLIQNTFDASGLTAGLHRVTVQARDTAGYWSVPEASLFARVNGVVSGYRYWLDDDVNTMVSAAVPPSGVVDLSAALPTATSTKPLRLITIQFLDPAGVYSVPLSKYFTRATGNVTGFEYWFDDDIANRVSGTLTPGTVVDLSSNIPVCLAAGAHTFAIRFSSLNGTWSVPLTREFTSTAPPDSDSDGTCDANDLCPGGPEPGTACDDGNAGTSGDVIQANCQCAGVLGCTVGAPCDDNNACTTGEVFDASCNCGGGAPVDPNDGDPCTLDSCDPITGVSNIFQDADNDGTCDANDLCPGGPEPGTACDDGNAATSGDIIQSNCQCAGMLGCTVGAPCNDNNACTTGEVFDASCNCGGGVPVDPNDGDPCTLDSCDPITGVSNIFQDADSDGTCDANDLCPGGPEPGTACDDGNAATSNDMIGANCLCAGFNPNCTEDLVLTINLDAFGSQTTWEVTEHGTGTVVASGGPYTNGSAGAVLENLCVAIGCYQLNVFDANGDGINAGGYVLTDDIGRRIVDANGLFNSTSSINVGTEADFCLPVTGTFVKANWCDRTNLTSNSFIYCQGVAAATGYQFWFFDPHGSYSRRILKPTTTCQLNWTTQPIPTGLDLNVRVRALVGGNYQPFGKACRLTVVAPGGSFRDMTSFETDGAHLSMYPNPNRDEVLYLMIEGLSEEAATAQVQIFDATGKRIASEQLNVAGGMLNHAMTLGTEMEAGLYFVHVLVDGQAFTERLVRQ